MGLKVGFSHLAYPAIASRRLNSIPAVLLHARKLHETSRDRRAHNFRRSYSRGHECCVFPWRFGWMNNLDNPLSEGRNRPESPLPFSNLSRKVRASCSLPMPRQKNCISRLLPSLPHERTARLRGQSVSELRRGTIDPSPPATENGSHPRHGMRARQSPPTRTQTSKCKRADGVVA